VSSERYSQTMSAYGSLFHDTIFPAWETGIRRRPTLSYRDRLEETQWLDRGQLLDFQAVELRKLIHHAFNNVPHYRAVMEGAGIVPSDIRSAVDLARLPILTKDIARACASQRSSTVEPFPTVKKSTGGSTGQPLTFGYDRNSEYWRLAMKMRGWGWAGYRLGEKMIYFWGPATGARPTWKKRLKVGVDRYVRRENYIDCTIRGDEQLAHVVEAIRREKPQGFICFSQSGADVARYIVEKKLRAWDTIPVLCCGEQLSPHARMLFTEAFGSAVFETYGCRELMLIGMECEHHDGLHMSMENVVVEVVVRDGEQERPARPGETGEVVLTDLHNFGMPFIRYANGDLATLTEDKPCACGRGLARLATVEGRVADSMRDGNGDPVCGILFSRIFAFSGGLADSVRQWQAIQHKDGSVTVKVVLLRELDSPTQENLRRGFGDYLKGLPLKVERVDEIPVAANGKRKTVVVEA
jgi:phenylacetate-CoA ligase